jgi:hypothetical protein
MSHDDHSNHTEVTTPDKQEVNQLKSVLIITFVKRRNLKSDGASVAVSKIC